MSEDGNFKKHADEALAALQRNLVMASDDYGFKSTLHGGAITIEFEHPPAKFHISRDASTQQLKAALGARSHKLDWDIVENTFLHPETRETLRELVEQAIGKHLKKEVEL